MSQLTLVVKGTRLCNLRCSYCNDWRAGKDQVMRFDVLANVIAKALRDPTHDNVTFVWHGGETTMLPRSFYEQALLLQARLRRPGQRILNGLQTNGTRLTSDWAKFFHDNDFRVGVSIDGPAELHDRDRRDARGRPTLDRALRGIQLLREHEVKHSVLMVVNEAALRLGPDAIFDFFLSEGIRHFGLLAVQPENLPDAPPGTETANYTAPPQMNAFLIGLYERWRREGDPGIWIRELGSLQRRINGGPGGMCTLAGGCLGDNFIIEPDGAVAHCDFFLGDENYVFGNIVDDDFAALRRNPRMRKLIAENDQALLRMSSCPEFGVCQGWCPHERYLSLRHNRQHRDDCCGLAGLITHLRSRLGQAEQSLPALPVV